MTITIKQLHVVVFLLLFAYPIFGMKKKDVRKRSTKHVRFADEKDNPAIINNSEEATVTSKKQPCSPSVCICCMNLTVAGVCSLASAAVMHFSNPQTTMRLYDYVNKTT